MTSLKTSVFGGSLEIYGVKELWKMIYDNINNFKLYTDLGETFKEAFKFITENQFEKTAPGRYPLSGSMFYLVQNYESKPVSEGLFEAHRKFIDLQYVVSGSERHDFAHISFMKQRDAYNDEKDLTVFDGKGSGLTMEKGFFAIYFPEDVHMPNIRLNSEPEEMIKVIVKIPV